MVTMILDVQSAADCSYEEQGSTSRDNRWLKNH